MATFQSCEMVYHHTKRNARFFNWCVGHFWWQVSDDGAERHLWMKLPAQDGRWGGSACIIPINPAKNAGGHGWNWDGNVERPTLTPSVFHDPNQPQSHHHWHGFITAGHMVGC